MASRAPLLVAGPRADELTCVSVLDGAVRLIFAGWLPQDGLFGWNASAGLKVERGAGELSIPLLLIGKTQIVPRAAASSSSWSGCSGVWVVEDFEWFHVSVEEGHSLIQVIPAGAWEESTWSTRSEHERR
jgi:hypothetical protein